MTRRHKVQSYSPVRVVRAEAALLSLCGKTHTHSCVGCGLTYTDGCDVAHENGRCQSCRTVGHARPIWERNADPADCCYVEGACQLVKHASELQKYRLAGPGPWFQCQRCRRSHARIPRRTA